MLCIVVVNKPTNKGNKMLQLTGTTLSDIVTIEATNYHAGNDWETGNHNIAQPNGAPKTVVKGRTYYFKITNKRGKEWANVKYQQGSGITYIDGKEAHPTIEDVMCSVYSDGKAVKDNTLEEFCHDFGYDTDSRKALAIYLHCQETLTKFNTTFNEEEQQLIEEFHELNF